MKTININLALIAIHIMDIDGNLCKMKFGYSEKRSDGKALKWHNTILENVFITGRAVSCINDANKPQYELGKTYVSENLSKNWKENPFCLKRKHRINQSGEHEAYYYLSTVEENGNYKKEVTLPDGSKAIQRVWRPNKPDYTYARYIDSYEKQKGYYEKAQSKAEATA